MTAAKWLATGAIAAAVWLLPPAIPAGQGSPDTGPVHADRSVFGGAALPGDDDPLRASDTVVEARLYRLVDHRPASPVRLRTVP